MGLLTKDVEIRLNGSNMKHFRDLGYNLPKWIDTSGKERVPIGSKIMVNVDDLLPYSTILVDRECDNCHNIQKIPYVSYLKGIKDGGLTYCSKCVHTLFCSGDNHFAWNNTLTDEERTKYRRCKEYTTFVKTVLKRDNYTCQCCSKNSSDLIVHHLDGFNWCIDGRTNPNNGITLCSDCHNSFHSIYGHGNNTKAQFEEWFGISINLIGEGIEINSAKKIYCYEDDIIYDNAKEMIKILNEKKLVSLGSITNIYLTCNYVHDLLHNKDNKYKNHTFLEKHIMWYDDYLNIDRNKLEMMIMFDLSITKPVICITTKEVFKSAKLGADKYNISRSNITMCCNKKTKYAGKHNGQKLVWMYYEEYLKGDI